MRTQASTETGVADDSTEPGVHFTPPQLALRLARCVFPSDGTEKRTAEAPLGVLDPACGEGELLIAAWRVGRESGLRPARIFGIERAPERAAAARRRLSREIGPAAAANVLVADALSPDTPWPTRTRVVANPPWMSFSGRQSVGGDRRDGVELPVRQGGGWPSLHGAFLERIAEHVASQQAQAAVLLPSATCDLDRYGPTRYRVSTRARLAAPPIELGEDAFPGVIEPAVIVELEPWPASTIDRGSTDAWTGVADFERRLIAALEKYPRLPPPCFGDIGVHTGNSARQLLATTGDALPPIREGRDLQAYHLGVPRLRLNTCLKNDAPRRFRYGALARYRGVPVLVRQTANRPIAALHTEPTYFRNTLLACTPPDALDPAFVVAVLNSPIAAAWHRLRFRDARQRSFPQVKISHLRTLPMPIAGRNEARAMHDRVANLVRHMANLPHSETDDSRKRVERAVIEAYDLDTSVIDDLLRTSGLG